MHSSVSALPNSRQRLIRCCEELTSRSGATGRWTSVAQIFSCLNICARELSPFEESRRSCLFGSCWQSSGRDCPSQRLAGAIRHRQRAASAHCRTEELLPGTFDHPRVRTPVLTRRPRGRRVGGFSDRHSIGGITGAFTGLEVACVVRLAAFLVDAGKHGYRASICSAERSPWGSRLREGVGG